ncbi:adenylate/guanylate cyclase domain-containing protein [uncultured Ruminococcus sp.]|uniref:adenylate/guanylate cyclase domain-containing protein n=1 Tax=uncultured Ruminococcus sp. TaxID=165186 RepID=UPI0025E1D8CA|nr:adenylate/guanylate cyclase domain-containing protein [uncultured Ruminococcus sp.]
MKKPGFIKKISLSPRKPFLFVLVLAVSLLLGLIANFISDEVYDTGSFLPELEVSPVAAKDIAVSADGLIAVDEIAQYNSLIYCGDPSTGRMRYMLGYDALSEYCGSQSRIHIVFGDKDVLYLHYVTWTDQYSAISSEGVLSISADGKSIAKICGFEYDDAKLPALRSPRLTAFSYSMGYLRFAYVDPSKTELYSIDTRTGTQTLEALYPAEEDGRYYGGVFALNRRYMLVRSDGDVFIAVPDEPLGDPVFSCGPPDGDTKDTNVILNAAEAAGKIYLTLDYNPETVYCFEETGFTEAVTLQQLYNEPDKHFYDDEYICITSLSTDGKRLIIGTCCDAFAMSPDGRTETLKTTFRVPVASEVSSILDLISDCLFIIAMILLLFLLIVKRKLLIKQLMLMIPLTIASVVVIYFFVQQHSTDIYLSDCTSEINAICELCLVNIDGDRLTPTNEDLMYNREQLLTMTNHSRSYWSSNYNIRICIPAGKYAYIYADSSSDAMPYTDVTESFTEEEILEDAIDGGIVSIYEYIDPDDLLTKTLLQGESNSYQAVAPIYDSSGNYVAFISVTNDSFNFVDMQERIKVDLIVMLVPIALVLVLAVVAVSIYTTGTIKKATDTVTKIANGDFTARTSSRARDELGEICRQVNTMASSLDTMFKEKDANEQFYYKFVPEKFRELLGKEKFTDLELGDAESRELTVLFTDIRSFSINSEIMTAKENFEFVNVIYGKAGPLVRKYGGFVDKYIGDAVMALFEDPDSAVACGIEMYHDIVLDPSTAEALGVSDINIGIGVHTGMARIGIVGESERLSGTVISDTVNLASRLESLTKQYHTAMLISKDTLDRMNVPESLDLRYLGILQVAGVNEVKAVYEVLDCMDGELRRIRSENKNDFREAVRLFHLGRRGDAVKQLQMIIDSGRADDTVRIYLDYISNMSEDDKGNVFRSVRK